MRVRIVRKRSAALQRDMLFVEAWAHSRDESVDELSWRAAQMFELDNYDGACAYAMELSMTKGQEKELALYIDGKPAEIAQTSPQA